MPQQGRDVFVISKNLTTYWIDMMSLGYMPVSLSMTTISLPSLPLDCLLAAPRRFSSVRAASHTKKKDSFNRRAREVPVSLLGRCLSTDEKCGLWCLAMGSEC
jgi:hypothetical protein